MCVPSIFVSLYPIKSFAYLIWIAFSYYVIFSLFYLFAKEYKNELFRAIMYSYRFQIILGLCLCIYGLQERVGLLYYEPSSFALSLIIYISFVVVKMLRYGPKSNSVDIILIFAALVVTKSGTLLLVLPLVYLLSIICYFNTLKTWIKSFAMFTVLIIVALLYVQSLNENDLLSRTLRGLLFTSGSINNSIEYLIGRGGNRFPRMQAAVGVFLHQPYYGQGIGAYDFKSIEQDIKEIKIDNLYYLKDIRETPPINIYFELLATGGLAALIGFVLFLVAIYSKNQAICNDYLCQSYYVSFLAFLIILGIEANYLRAYLWMLFGMYAGSCYMEKT
jgi:hypothetical protein